MKLHELVEEKEPKKEEGSVTIHTSRGSYMLTLYPSTKELEGWRRKPDAHLGARGGE